MTRVFLSPLPLLPLLFSLLLLVLSPAPSYSATLHFTAQCTAGPFSRRSHVNVEFHAQAVTWTKANTGTVTATNVLILQGNDNALENDVWISSDKGSTWDLLSGISRVNGGYYPAPSGYDTQSYSPAATAVGFTTDQVGRIFRISGQTSDPSTQGTCVTDVWMSTDGKTWQNRQTLAGANFPAGGGRKYASAISDRTDRIYLLGGQTCDWTQLRDVWTSTNQGIAWTQATATVPFSGTVAGVFLAIPVNSRAQLGNLQEVLIHASGWDPSTNSDRNDVWVSSNGASTWLQMTIGAAFTNRDDANAEVTRDGIIIVMGGKRETIVGGQVNTEVLNDVWVSGDGGYTWSICAVDAEWDDRRYQASALDNQGNLYVVAGLGPGENVLQNKRNDVWISDISFFDLASVESQCSLQRPACGYGLTCLPTSPGFQRLARGVTCNALIACGGPAMDTSLDFKVQTTQAPWSRRAAPFAGLLRIPLAYRAFGTGAAVTAPANSFILHGTSNYLENDVWISTDRMVTWNLVAGVSSYGANFGGRAYTPADVTSFTPATYGGAYGISAAGRLYRVSGEQSSGVCGTDVWTSLGGLTWTRYSHQQYFSGRIWASLVISPSDSSVTIFGGRTCANSQSQFDVWRSNNNGQTWTRVSENTFTAAGPRNGMAGIHRSTVFQKEVISYAGGWDGNADYNDVQASSDGGATWATVTTAANWQRRDDIAGLVTPGGIMVLVGGKTNTAQGEVFHNDIWVSLDGGYSWGRCTEDLAFVDRRYEAITLDEAGYLYVVAGETNERNPREYLNDAWRSTISFSNASLVASSCGLSVPSCGTGLNCWPGAMGTVREPGNAGCVLPGLLEHGVYPASGFRPHHTQCTLVAAQPRQHGAVQEDHRLHTRRLQPAGDGGQRARHAGQHEWSRERRVVEL